MFTGLINWRGLRLSHIWTIHLRLRLRLTMLRFSLGFQYFFRFNFVFLFVKSYVGWEICVLASHLHVFCFQSEGGVKNLRTGKVKKFQDWWGGVGGALPIWGRGCIFAWGGGGSVPHYMPWLWLLKCQKWLIFFCIFCWWKQKMSHKLEKIFKDTWKILLSSFRKWYS